MTSSNMPQLGLLVLSILFCTQLTAQRQETILLNTQEIDENRYEGVRGYPFIWKEWQSGVVIDDQGGRTEVEEINYNAHTKTFEVKKGGRFIELVTDGQKQIVITSLEEPHTFQKDIHPDLPLEFNQLLYNGSTLQLVKSTEKKISTKVFQNVGKEVTVEQFVKRETFYLVENDQLRRLKVSKKALLKELEQSKKLESFIKKNKLKFKQDADLVKLITHYEASMK